MKEGQSKMPFAVNASSPEPLDCQLGTYLLSLVQVPVDPVMETRSFLGLL